MHVAVASDHQLASLSEVPKSFTYLYHCTSTEVAVPQYAKARGCLGIKSAITDYASKLFTIWIDKNGCVYSSSRAAIILFADRAIFQMVFCYRV
jgi:hypothetical protein